MQLKPDNIKSIHEWKDFVKEKTIDEFKRKPNGKLVSRVEVWKTICTKKNGELINAVAADAICQMNEIEKDHSNLTSSDLKDDVVSKVIGPDKSYVKALGKGVTFAQLTLISHKDMVIAQVLKDQDEMKKELAQYRKFFEEMQKKRYE
ncbi:hypothetical protein WN944_019049 [Citrus x changshan-huyou]|uniref:Transposase n=1 Tax=Citrus x changshan-huyou TaxID=2935761 RepID=A0AAP0LVH4_9ROSI